MNKKFVAIGDIHGCVRSLKTLWNKLKPHKDAIHIFIGDYIDRGPDSKGVVDFLLDVRYDRECIFLRGNHEQMLLDSLQNNDNRQNWMYNGGDVTLKSYNYPRHVSEIPAAHKTFFEETQIYYESDYYFFVHAGAPPHQTLEQSIYDSQSEHFFLWGREHLNVFETPWEKTVVFGHTPRPFPIRKPNMIGIDTGCVYDELGYGKLTAVVLPETEFIQQESLD